MRTNMWKISTLAVTGALALVVGNGLVRDASADPQPRMVSALEHLKAARADLMAAKANKGGYRVKAIDLVNQAIEATKTGIAFANKS